VQTNGGQTGGGTVHSDVHWTEVCVQPPSTVEPQWTTATQFMPEQVLVVLVVLFVVDWKVLQLPVVWHSATLVASWGSSTAALFF